MNSKLNQGKLNLYVKDFHCIPKVGLNRGAAEADDSIEFSQFESMKKLKNIIMQ